MNYIAYSEQDSIAAAVISELRRLVKFEREGSSEGYEIYGSASARLIAIKSPVIHSEFLGKLGAERIIFVSRHSSSKGITSFTAHAAGNWSASNEFGGAPRALSVASPAYMLSFLKIMRRINETAMPVTYEATHHGPLLGTPSLFIEIGPVHGGLDTSVARMFAKGITGMVATEPAIYGKVAIGIGGTHYPEKFTKLALEEKYTFSHIMSKYYTGEYQMIGEAIQRSEQKAELAVIDWKSIRSENKQNIIKELEGLGLGYEKA